MTKFLKKNKIANLDNNMDDYNDMNNYNYLNYLDNYLDNLDNYENLSSDINPIQNQRIENPVILSKVHVIQSISGTGAIYYEPENELAKSNNAPQIIILSNHKFTQQNNKVDHDKNQLN